MASSKISGGRMPREPRWASMVLPVPAAPIMMILWPPAADRGFGEAHGGEGRQPRGQVHLHLHNIGVHALQGAAFHPG